jgi:hypothetical protein
MFSNKRPHVVLLGFVLSCLVLSGCSTDSVTGGGSKSTVRFANAMTGGSGSLVFNVNGSTSGQTVTYQQFGNCQQLNAASTDFSVMLLGGSGALATLSGETLTDGSKYTLLATGSTSIPTLIFLTDTYTTPATGRGRLRVVNAVDAGTSFDVYIGAPGPLGTVGPLDVGFNTSPAFVDVPEGLTQVRVTIPGTQTVIGTSVNFTVNSGDVTTLVFAPATTVGGALTSFFVPECP